MMNFLLGLLSQREASPSVPEREVCFEKVDASWFPAGTYAARQAEVLHGPVAQFWPSGHLRSLIHFSRGQPSLIHNRLELAEFVSQGTVVSLGCFCEFKSGVERMIVEFEGESSCTEEPIVWSDWVKKWLRAIAGNVPVTLPPPADEQPPPPRGPYNPGLSGS